MEFIFSVAAVCDLQSTILKGILKQTAVLLTNKIYVKVNSRKIINVLVTSKRNKASKPSIKKMWENLAILYNSPRSCQKKNVISI